MFCKLNQKNLATTVSKLQAKEHIFYWKQMLPFQLSAGATLYICKITRQYMTRKPRPRCSCKFCVSVYSGFLVIKVQSRLHLKLSLLAFFGHFANFSTQSCGDDYEFSTNTSRTTSDKNLVAPDFTFSSYKGSLQKLVFDGRWRSLENMKVWV